MLFCPLVVGLAATPHVRPLPALLLSLTLVGAFLARHAADLALRPRQRSQALPWLRAYGAFAAAAGAWLLAITPSWRLLLVAAAAGVLYLVHLALRRTRSRLDRTVWGELVGVAALCLGAPAARVVGGGALDGGAWALWALCWLFFGSSIFHVRGLLEAARVRGGFGRPERLRVARPGLIYHLGAAAGFAALPLWLPSVPPALLWLSVAPAFLRAAIGLARRSNGLPPLPLVGLGESFCTLWFTVALVIALR
jgi:hypothetical protein